MQYKKKKRPTDKPSQLYIDAQWNVQKLPSILSSSPYPLTQLTNGRTF